ncbi:MAG: zf-HC2 domain-containing protein [Acidobacteriota bacterium]
MNCPPFEKLIAYLEGEADKPLTLAVHSHLESCASCNAARAWYEQVKAIAANDETVAPPEWVLRRASKIFGSQNLRETFVERAGRLIAALVFDSFGNLGFAGARSFASAERQLLYRAEPYSIDLQLTPAADAQGELKGQILRDDEFKFDSVAEVELHLLRDGQTILTTNTNKFGEFSLSKLATGNYDLQFETREISITVVGLPVG